jgi:hypothetical protein
LSHSSYRASSKLRSFPSAPLMRVEARWDFARELIFTREPSENSGSTEMSSAAAAGPPAPPPPAGAAVP